MFSKFIGPVNSTWVMSLSENKHTVFAERLLAKQMFARSRKVMGWQLGTAKHRDHDFRKKHPGCFEFTGLVTTIWVLSLPETMHMVFTERILARAVLARSIEVRGWQLGQKYPRSRFLQKKGPISFEMHWTSDTPKSTVALSNQTFGLCRVILATQCLQGH